MMGSNVEELTADVLTSTMGSVLSGNSETSEKSTVDSVPSSSSDANRIDPNFGKKYLDDPISSTSDEGNKVDFAHSKPIELPSMSGTKVTLKSDIDNEADMFASDISVMSTQKITENVDDLVSDLENLLGESADFTLPLSKSSLKTDLVDEVDKATDIRAIDEVKISTKKETIGEKDNLQSCEVVVKSDLHIDANAININISEPKEKQITIPTLKQDVDLVIEPDNLITTESSNTIQEQRETTINIGELESGIENVEKNHPTTPTITEDASVQSKALEETPTIEDTACSKISITEVTQENLSENVKNIEEKLVVDKCSVNASDTSKELFDVSSGVAVSQSTEIAAETIGEESKIVEAAEVLSKSEENSCASNEVDATNSSKTEDSASSNEADKINALNVPEEIIICDIANSDKLHIDDIDKEVSDEAKVKITEEQSNVDKSEDIVQGDKMEVTENVQNEVISTCKIETEAEEIPVNEPTDKMEVDKDVSVHSATNDQLEIPKSGEIEEDPNESEAAGNIEESNEALNTRNEVEELKISENICTSKEELESEEVTNLTKVEDKIVDENMSNQEEKEIEKTDNDVKENIEVEEKTENAVTCLEDEKSNKIESITTQIEKISEVSENEVVSEIMEDESGVQNLEKGETETVTKESDENIINEVEDSENKQDIELQEKETSSATNSAVGDIAESEIKASFKNEVLESVGDKIEATECGENIDSESKISLPENVASDNTAITEEDIIPSDLTPVETEPNQEVETNIVSESTDECQITINSNENKQDISENIEIKTMDELETKCEIEKTEATDASGPAISVNEEVIAEKHLTEGVEQQFGSNSQSEETTINVIEKLEPESENVIPLIHDSTVAQQEKEEEESSQEQEIVHCEKIELAELKENEAEMPMAKEIENTEESFIENVTGETIESEELKKTVVESTIPETIEAEDLENEEIVNKSPDVVENEVLQRERIASAKNETLQIEETSKAIENQNRTEISQTSDVENEIVMTESLTKTEKNVEILTNEEVMEEENSNSEPNKEVELTNEEVMEKERTNAEPNDIVIVKESKLEILLREKTITATNENIMNSTSEEDIKLEEGKINVEREEQISDSHGDASINEIQAVKEVTKIDETPNAPVDKKIIDDVTIERNLISTSDISEPSEKGTEESVLSQNRTESISLEKGIKKSKGTDHVDVLNTITSEDNMENTETESIKEIEHIENIEIPAVKEVTKSTENEAIHTEITTMNKSKDLEDDAKCGSINEEVVKQKKDKQHSDKIIDTQINEECSEALKQTNNDIEKPTLDESKDTEVEIPTTDNVENEKVDTNQVDDSSVTMKEELVVKDEVNESLIAEETAAPSNEAINVTIPVVGTPRQGPGRGRGRGKRKSTFKNRTPAKKALIEGMSANELSQNSEKPVEIKRRKKKVYPVVTERVSLRKRNKTAPEETSKGSITDEPKAAVTFDAVTTTTEPERPMNDEHELVRAALEASHQAERTVEDVPASETDNTELLQKAEDQQKQEEEANALIQAANEFQRRESEIRALKQAAAEADVVRKRLERKAALEAHKRELERESNKLSKKSAVQSQYELKTTIESDIKQVEEIKKPLNIDIDNIQNPDIFEVSVVKEAESTTSDHEIPKSSHQSDEQPEYSSKISQNQELKLTITKNRADESVSILKIYDPKNPNTIHTESEETPIPKLIIKQSQCSPKVLSPLKLTIKTGINKDEPTQKGSPKLIIKPILKPDDDIKIIDEKHHSPKITIKPIVKPNDDIERCNSPKITIKPIIKPIEASTSPKIKIKPIIKPDDLKEEIQIEEEETKERIVLKINKSNISQKDKKLEDVPSEKISKIKVKFSKERKRAHIINDEDVEEDRSPAKRLHMDEIEAEKKRQKLENPIENIPKENSPITSTITTPTMPLMQPETPVMDVSVEIPTPRKRGRPRKVPLQIREEFKEEQPLETQEAVVPETPPATPTSGRPKRSCRGPSVSVTLGIKPRKPRGTSVRARGTRGSRGGRVEKPPKKEKVSESKLKLIKEAAITAQVAESLENQDVDMKIVPPEFQTIIIDDSSEEKDIKSEQVKNELKEDDVDIKDLAEIKDEAGIKSEKSELELKSSDVVMYEEETRMSAETSISRAQTPAKQELSTVAPDIVVEESQSSVQSTATTESAKVRKGVRSDLLCELDTIISADQLAEYYWGGGGPYMLQEQVAQFLGIKSFKRKYPGIQRRMVDMQERDFIRESSLASEHMCDLGLTAVNTADILDIMYSDFQNKYEEYCKHQRDRQTKDITNKQKALSLAVNQEKTRLDIMQQAVDSAAQWNSNFNKTRREERKACMDLQTFTINYPKGKIKQIPKAKTGHYPIALVPGQYTDYYKNFTATELNNLPLNTMLYNEINISNEEDSQSDGSGSVTDSSSSDSDSSDSDSSDEDCICSSATQKKAVA